MGALLTIMSPPESCCTCATLLSDVEPLYATDTADAADPVDSKNASSPSSEISSEKPLASDRRLDCCGRVICGRCQVRNARFKTYCPFCQISSSEGSIPKEGLRLPPSYTTEKPSSNGGGSAETSLRSVLGQRDGGDDEAPPPYSPTSQRKIPATHPSATSAERQTQTTDTDTSDDTTHHLSPTDTLSSLSLLYHVPLPVLRQHNSFPPTGGSDYLLAARKHILIPASYYSGPNLSTPPDPEVEERKNKIRKFMVLTKCVDYGVAGLYLKSSGWRVEEAVGEWRGDEKWERENPLKGKGKEGRRKGWLGGGGGSLVGQLS